MPKPRIGWKAAAPALLLLIGAVIVALLVFTRPEPAQEQAREPPPAVRVVTVRRGTADVTVRARGSVVAAKRVELRPNVSGPIVWVAEELTPGGRFETGDLLFRVDPRDYRYAVQQRRDTVRRARVALREERNRQRVSEREWELFGEGPPEGMDPAFAKRIPQVKAAEAALQAARAQLAQAQLDLARTSVEAPFDCVIESESIDEGQRVGPETPVATLVGTDSFRVQTSIEVAKLAALDVPESGQSGHGSPAVIWHRAKGQLVERTGHVQRLLDELDPEGNMARVIIQVDDPLALEPETEGLPLLRGTYVQVAIEAKPLPDVIAVPREALRGSRRVWVVGDQGRLEIRDVDVAWSGEEMVYVRTGLRDGDRVVLDRLPTPVEGMKLRIAEERGVPARAEGR